MNRFVKHFQKIRKRSMKLFNPLYIDPNPLLFEFCLSLTFAEMRSESFENFSVLKRKYFSKFFYFYEIDILKLYFFVLESFPKKSLLFIGKDNRLSSTGASVPQAASPYAVLQGAGVWNILSPGYTAPIVFAAAVTEFNKLGCKVFLKNLVNHCLMYSQ